MEIVIRLKTNYILTWAFRVYFHKVTGGIRYIIAVTLVTQP